MEGAHRSGDLGSLSRALASLSPPPGLGGAVEGRAGRERQLGASHKLLREQRREERERESGAGAPAWLFFATKQPVAGGVRTAKPSPNPPSRKAIGSAKPNRSVSLAAQRGRSLQGGADLVAPPVFLGMALFAFARCPDTRARLCPAQPSPAQSVFQAERDLARCFLPLHDRGERTIMGQARCLFPFAFYLAKEWGKRRKKTSFAE